MCAKGTVPINTEVVVKGGFLGKLCTYDTCYIAKSFNVLGRCTILRQVVLFVAAVEDIAETILDGEETVNLVARRDIEIELCLFLEVLVVTITILQNPIGVDQARIAVAAAKHIGVVVVAIDLA